MREEVSRLPEFESFVTARMPALMRYAMALTGSAYAAEDLVQDALVRAGARWEKLGENPEPYVRKIMANARVSLWRRRRREVLVAEPADRPAREVRDKPDELVWAVLATLPRGQRAVLVLRFYEGLSEAETAAVLGCSTGSVKSQTAKAKTKIKAALQAAQAQEEALWTR